MIGRIGGWSQHRQARAAGVFYVLRIVLAAVAEVFLAHASLQQLGNATEVVSTACYVAVVVALYGLFKPATHGLSLLAATLGLTGCMIVLVSNLVAMAPENVRPGVLDWLVRNQNIELVFFGLYDVLVGYLILRSSLLPRALGVLTALAGLGWLTYLSPGLADRLYPYNLIPGSVGEAALALWLLAVGLNGGRLTRKLRGRGAPPPTSRRTAG